MVFHLYSISASNPGLFNICRVYSWSLTLLSVFSLHLSQSMANSVLNHECGALPYFVILLIVVREASLDGGGLHNMSNEATKTSWI
ncbi:MAG: hypothetical protein J3Q66DRAFT_321462, partial [Benniella sp.]